MKIPPNAKSPHGATVIRVVKLNKNKLGASLVSYVSHDASTSC